jgi:hypothetical protein
MFKRSQLEGSYNYFIYGLFNNAVKIAAYAYITSSSRT